jgi:hypothetical protein
MIYTTIHCKVILEHDFPVLGTSLFFVLRTHCDLLLKSCFSPPVLFLFLHYPVTLFSVSLAKQWNPIPIKSKRVWRQSHWVRANYNSFNKYFWFSCWVITVSYFLNSYSVRVMYYPSQGLLENNCQLLCGECADGKNWN